MSENHRLIANAKYTKYTQLINKAQDDEAVHIYNASFLLLLLFFVSTHLQYLIVYLVLDLTILSMSPDLDMLLLLDTCREACTVRLADYLIARHAASAILLEASVARLS